MSAAYHDCPFCRCREAAEAAAGVYDDDVYDDDYHRWTPADRAEAKRRAAEATERTLAERQARGRTVCAAPTRAGGRCLGHVIRGSDLCSSHAPTEVREARDYGRALGEMAVPADRVLAVGGDQLAVIEAAWADVVRQAWLNAL